MKNPTSIICTNCPVPLPCPAHSTTHHLRSLDAHCLEGGYKYTSSFSCRRKKRMQMGENCSSAAPALTRRIMRSECRQECVEEWSWQGFTSLNYSKPIPSLIKLFCFFIFYFGVQRCFMELFVLEHKIQALFTQEQILVYRILLFG